MLLPGDQLFKSMWLRGYSYSNHHGKQKIKKKERVKLSRGSMELRKLEFVFYILQGYLTSPLATQSRNIAVCVCMCMYMHIIYAHLLWVQLCRCRGQRRTTSVLLYHSNLFPWSTQPVWHYILAEIFIFVAFLLNYIVI